MTLSFLAKTLFLVGVVALKETDVTCRHQAVPLRCNATTIRETVHSKRLLCLPILAGVVSYLAIARPSSSPPDSAVHSSQRATCDASLNRILAIQSERGRLRFEGITDGASVAIGIVLIYRFDIFICFPIETKIVSRRSFQYHPTYRSSKRFTLLRTGHVSQEIPSMCKVAKHSQRQHNTTQVCLRRHPSRRQICGGNSTP